MYNEYSYASPIVVIEIISRSRWSSCCVRTWMDDSLVAMRTGFLLQQSIFNNMKNSYFLKLKLDQIHRIGLCCELNYEAIVSWSDCIRSTGDFGHTDIIFSYSPLIHPSQKHKCEHPEQDVHWESYTWHAQWKQPRGAWENNFEHEMGQILIKWNFWFYKLIPKIFNYILF